MDNTKLSEIIAQKNVQLERQAVARASEIIDMIAQQQEIIVDANASIKALREELAMLQVQQINPVSILGD